MDHNQTKMINVTQNTTQIVAPSSSTSQVISQGSSKLLLTMPSVAQSAETTIKHARVVSMMDDSEFDPE
jgi:hypothetical protein